MANLRFLAVFISISNLPLIYADAVSSLPTRITSLVAQPTYSGTIPSCAQSCLSEATGSLPCQDTDSRCLCLHTSDVQNSVKFCLSSSNACSKTDTEVAVAYYGNICQALGYQTDLTTTAIGSAGPQPTVDIVSATGQPSPVPTQIIATSTPSSTSNQNSGLSTPVIAGIAAGVALFLAITITTAVYFILQRRSRRDIIIHSEEDTEMRRRRDTDRSGHDTFSTEIKDETPPTTGTTLVPRSKSVVTTATEISDNISFKTTRENVSIENEKSLSKHLDPPRERINPLSQHPSPHEPTNFDFGLRAPTPGGFTFDFVSKKTPQLSPNISRRPSETVSFNHSTRSSVSAPDYAESESDTNSETVTIGVGVARAYSVATATTADYSTRNSRGNELNDSRHNSTNHKRWTKPHDHVDQEPMASSASLGSRWGDGPMQRSKDFV